MAAVKPAEFSEMACVGFAWVKLGRAGVMLSDCLPYPQNGSSGSVQDMVAGAGEPKGLRVAAEIQWCDAPSAPARRGF